MSKTKTFTEAAARTIYYREMIVDLPVFNYDLKVVIASDMRLYGQAFYKDAVKDLGIGGMHIYDKDRCRSIIIFNDNPKIKAIAHEVFHVVWRIMEHVGAVKDNETMAYHQGYLTEKCVKWVLAQGENWYKKDVDTEFEN